MPCKQLSCTRIVVTNLKITSASLITRFWFSEKCKYNIYTTTFLGGIASLTAIANEKSVPGMFQSREGKIPTNITYQ